MTSLNSTINTSHTSNISEDLQLLGKVKWYNMELRYGFITLLDDNKDIFVHKNNLKSELKYKCLFKGEYVLLNLITTDKGLQCNNVTGVNGDLLLCESNPELIKKIILSEYIEKSNPNLSLFKISS